GDTKESVMPSLRIAPALSGASGGVITASHGGIGEAQVMGVEADWVDYHGARRTIAGDEVVEGIAILNHPANPGHPPKVFAREYGPLCTAQGNYFTGPSTLGAGQQ